MHRLSAIAVALVTLISAAVLALPGTPDELHPAEGAPRFSVVVLPEPTTTQAIQVLNNIGTIDPTDRILEEIEELATVSTTTTTTSPPPTQASSSPKPTTPPAPKTTTTTAAPSPSGGYNASYENDFYRRINGLRSAHGLPALSRHGGLDSHARSWAKKMAEAGTLKHSSLKGVLSLGFGKAGENVGRGGSVKGIFEMLVASSGHQQNMLDGVFTHVGVGAWVDANGTIWTVHVFAG